MIGYARREQYFAPSGWKKERGNEIEGLGSVGMKMEIRGLDDERREGGSDQEKERGRRKRERRLNGGGGRSELRCGGRTQLLR